MIAKRIETLNKDQKTLFDHMINKYKGNYCFPTGVGKGYVFITHILWEMEMQNKDIFAIASHRLLLNSQHLEDLFKSSIENEIYNVSFIFVGSDMPNVNKIYNKYKNEEYINFLKEKSFSKNDIFLQATSTNKVDSKVEHLKKIGQKIILITTYNSMGKLKNVNIDNMYFDEAHVLASNKEASEFRNNFETLTENNDFNRYFFSATPKDCIETVDGFLMNNIDIFGERLGMTFRDAVDKNYITKPIIHTVRPENLVEHDNGNIESKARFVRETFEKHKKFIIEKSRCPEKIAPKLLIKCKSVDEMWELYEQLISEMNDSIFICAGASRGQDDSPADSHKINDNNGKNWSNLERDEYLKKIKDLNPENEAIILHFDILSEGLNVSGFTGVMLFDLLTLTKMVQNIGRATRLHPEDRKDVFDGNIRDKIKPYCSVIIPYWNSETSTSKEVLSNRIIELRDKYGFTYEMVGYGDDTGESDTNSIEGINKKDNDRKKDCYIDDDLKHMIEEIDINKEKELEQEKLNKMEGLEFLKYIKNK